MREIELYDHHGQILSLNDGVTAIGKALSWLNRKGFSQRQKVLKDCLDLLDWTDKKIKEGFYQ
jgi:hypothetical protein